MEWQNKKSICKSRVASLVGVNTVVYARKTKIVKLSSPTANRFFNDNHIQGNASASLYVGLELNGELVCAMSLGKSRFNNYQHELIRYCSSINTNVVGGASRLFKYAVSVLDADSVVSFCDLRWGTGKLYENLNFIHIRNNTSSYLYTNNYRTLENRQKYQKKKLSKKLLSFDSNLSEWENMKTNGYDRYWDSGNAVYLWTSPDKCHA